MQYHIPHLWDKKYYSGIWWIKWITTSNLVLLFFDHFIRLHSSNWASRLLGLLKVPILVLYRVLWGHDRGVEVLERGRGLGVVYPIPAYGLLCGHLWIYIITFWRKNLGNATRMLRIWVGILGYTVIPPHIGGIRNMSLVLDESSEVLLVTWAWLFSAMLLGSIGQVSHGWLLPLGRSMVFPSTTISLQNFSNRDCRSSHLRWIK